MKSKIGIIIGREFNERVQKKSFILTTLLTPLLLIALMLAPVLIASYSDEDIETVVVVDDSKSVACHLANSKEIAFEQTMLPLDIARAENKECYAILHIGNDIINNPADAQLYTNDTHSMATEQDIMVQLTLAVQKERMKMYGIDPQVMMELNTPVAIQSLKNTSSDEATIGSSTMVATALAYAFSFILYMFLILYGVMVMQSVIEEKNNRVLEVLVSTVRPFDMMMGKILGIACVALLQIAIWIALIAGAVHFVLPHVLPGELMASMDGASSAMGTDSSAGLLQALTMMMENIDQVGGMALWFIVFMFGGFLLYAAMFAAVGSAVDSPQEAQQLQTPIMLPIILALFVMLSVINDPSSDVAFWFSMIPLTSPIVMMARIPYEIPTWEICLSAVLLYATFLVVVWGAGKIYRVGILMHGKKPSLKEMFRWIRYK